MTIIVFLVDTSASMAMKTYLGTTILDFARKTVEEFVKQLTMRQARETIRDRYMLMTFDEYPNNVKIDYQMADQNAKVYSKALQKDQKTGWKEGVAIFNEQLKNLKANGITSFGAAFGSALRFINLNRMQIGLENYGFGRNPTYTDPVVFVAITDGASLSEANIGIVEEIKFSKPIAVGNELTEEPFRWDQRLFSIVLRLPGGQVSKLKTPFVIPPDPNRSIEEMCNVTGGRSYSITSHKMLNSCVEMIIQKIQMNGVLIKLEKYGPDPTIFIPSIPQNGVITNGMDSASTSESDLFKSRQIQFPDGAWRSQLAMILRANKFVSSSSTGYWPIPEAFWPDANTTALPPRRAHPIVLFKCEQHEPVINTEFPFDKYELEYCALTQYILEKKQPNLCWQVYVANSFRQTSAAKDTLGHPFGYLKVSSNMQNVTLVILPYNYPMLMSILEEGKDKRVRSSPQWVGRMSSYFNTVPPYYVSALKKHLKKLNISHPIIDDPMKDQVYSQQVITHLTKIKYIGKEEFDTACAAVQAAMQNQSKQELDRIRNLVPVKKSSSSKPDESKKSNKYQPLIVTQAMSKLANAVEERFKDYRISIQEPKIKPPPSMQFLNAFDIEKKDLLEQMQKMRLNLEMHLRNSKLQLLEGGKPGSRIRLQHAEDLHNQPIQQMGDYQTYMQSLHRIGFAPLRELEPSSAKPHAFGNPFKLDKKNMTIDEVGEANSSLPNLTTKTPADRQERRQENVERSQRRKRKAGPLDQATVNNWRMRRRLRSVSSDTSSVVSTSDLSDASELARLLVDDDILLIGETNGWTTSQRLTIDETDDDDGRFSPDSFIPQQKELNGFSSQKHPRLTSTPIIDLLEEDEVLPPPSKRPRINSTNSIPRTPTTPIGGPSFPSRQEVLTKLHEVKNDLQKLVRKFGDRTKQFEKCLAIVHHLTDTEKEDALRHALREAERFKITSLVQNLSHEINRIVRRLEMEQNALNNSKDLISDILGPN